MKIHIWFVAALLATLVLFWPRSARAQYESEIAAFEAADAANPPPANAIPFVGSSSIKMWPTLSAAFPKHPVLNRGFGGSQMVDVLTYFDRVVARYHAPLVVVYEGDNDLAAGKSVSQVFADYSNFVWRVNTELPETDIAFISVKPSPSRTNVMAAMAQLNALIQGMADGRHIRYIDVFTPMLDTNGQPRVELFGSDMLHMNATGYALWNSIVGPVLDQWATSAGGTFLFDFGAAANTTEKAAAPDDPDNLWNNVTEAIGVSAYAALTNLMTVDNSATAMALEIISPFTAANNNGTTVSPLFASEATRDSLYGNTELFNGQSNIFPSFKLTGLDTQLLYQLTFFASRTNAAENRETVYTVSGASNATVVLNAANNVTGTVTVAAMPPAHSGEITISLAPSTNNNSTSHFTYLGVMKLEAVPPQRPITLLRQPASVTVTAGKPATFTAAASGSPPFYIQWFSNGIAIPGANQFTYSIAAASPSMSGASYRVSVSNLAFSVTSTNAVLTVTEPPAELETQVLLIDFGAAANTTEHAASPDDPLNYWNNVTDAIGTSSTGQLLNMVTIQNAPTTINFVVQTRFAGVNGNGTTASTVYPSEATRDSLYGNTETFNGLANIFPRFKLTGLNPARTYNLTFYASRTGTTDNRETTYGVAGANTNSVALNAANNINNTVTLTNARPSPGGELTISLTPGAANNNANHFTYLGALKLELGPVLRHLPATIVNGQIQMRWTGAGQLEYAPAVTGPWSTLSATGNTYSEGVLLGTNRFYRLRMP